MKPRLIAIPLLSAALLSCDKAKDIATKASSAVQQQMSATSGANDDTKVDPELQKLVDQTAEGVIFRKDLPFSSRLEVRTTRSDKISGRLFSSSEIEKRSGVMNVDLLEVSKLERAGNQVRHTVEQSSSSAAAPEGAEKPAKPAETPLKKLNSLSPPVTFVKSGNAWTSKDKDGFRASVISKQLSPVFDILLVDNALAPRPLWFAERRYKIGDTLVVNGDSMPMLLAGDAKGSLNLKLESFQAVGGHPCGVFSVTGNYRRKGFPDFDGGSADEDVTIQSGKIWLSLIHPLVLKEEMETIQSSKTGGQGGLVTRIQGTVKVAVKREWKAL